MTEQILGFLQVFCVRSFHNVVDDPTVVHFCPNIAKYALIHLLYGSYNPNLLGIEDT